jgi:hypothetical protein
MTFRQRGVDTSQTVAGNTTTSVEQKIDLLFKGTGWASFELQPPGEEGFLTVTVSGSGVIRIHKLVTQATSATCDNPRGPYSFNVRSEYNSVVTTNFFGATNDNTYAVYDFSFLVQTNKTYELDSVSYDNSWSLSAESDNSVRNWVSGSCPGTPPETEFTSKTKQTYNLPFYNSLAQPVFPMPSADVVSGSLSWQETSSQIGGTPIILQSVLEWNFQRNTNVPSLGP